MTVQLSSHPLHNSFKEAMIKGATNLYKSYRRKGDRTANMTPLKTLFREWLRAVVEPTI